MELEVGIVGLLIIIGHWEVHLRNDQCMVSVHIQWKEIIQGLLKKLSSKQISFVWVEDGIVC